MDVNDVSNVINLARSPLKATDKPGGTGGFMEIYRSQLEAVSRPDAVSRQDARTDLLDRILDLLDAYAAELDNPLKSLKEIDPLTRAIEREMDLFGERRSSHPQADAELQGLAEALEITAHVALLKFRRGDYV